MEVERKRARRHLIVRLMVGTVAVLGLGILSFIRMFPSANDNPLSDNVVLNDKPSFNCSNLTSADVEAALGLTVSSASLIIAPTPPTIGIDPTIASGLFYRNTTWSLLFQEELRKSIMVPVETDDSISDSHTSVELFEWNTHSALAPAVFVATNESSGSSNNNNNESTTNNYNSTTNNNNSTTNNNNSNLGVLMCNANSASCWALAGAIGAIIGIFALWTQTFRLGSKPKRVQQAQTVNVTSLFSDSGNDGNEPPKENNSHSDPLHGLHGGADGKDSGDSHKATCESMDCKRSAAKIGSLQGGDGEDDGGPPGSYSSTLNCCEDGISDKQKDQQQVQGVAVQGSSSGNTADGDSDSGDDATETNTGDRQAHRFVDSKDVSNFEDGMSRIIVQDAGQPVQPATAPTIPSSPLRLGQSSPCKADDVYKGFLEHKLGPRSPRLLFKRRLTFEDTYGSIEVCAGQVAMEYPTFESTDDDDDDKSAPIILHSEDIDASGSGQFEAADAEGSLSLSLRSVSPSASDAYSATTNRVGNDLTNTRVSGGSSHEQVHNIFRKGPGRENSGPSTDTVNGKANNVAAGIARDGDLESISTNTNEDGVVANAGSSEESHVATSTAADDDTVGDDGADAPVVDVDAAPCTVAVTVNSAAASAAAGATSNISTASRKAHPNQRAPRQAKGRQSSMPLETQDGGFISITKPVTVDANLFKDAVSSGEFEVVQRVTLEEAVKERLASWGDTKFTFYNEKEWEDAIMGATTKFNEMVASSPAVIAELDRKTAADLASGKMKVPDGFKVTPKNKTTFSATMPTKGLKTVKIGEFKTKARAVVACKHIEESLNVNLIKRAKGSNENKNKNRPSTYTARTTLEGFDLKIIACSFQSHEEAYHAAFLAADVFDYARNERKIEVVEDNYLQNGIFDPVKEHVLRLFGRKG